MAWKFNPFTGKLDYYESGTSGTVGEAPINGIKYARKDGGWVTFSEAGAPAWGSITGTLSSQTDLQTALNGKANSLGADDNYVTDAEKVVIGNTSGTNTGDNAVNSNYSGLATSKVDVNVAITGSTKTKITYDTKGLVTSGADATTADIADSLNKRYVTDANLTTIGNLSGTNSGDQTSIVGITGTKAQFDTAVTDGNILYVGDITQYTDELAQDAVGAMVDATIVYTDGTPLLSRAALTGAITAPAGSNATSLGSFTTAQLNTALSDNDVATGGGTATGTNTGDQVIKDTFGITVDGAGTALTTGTKGYRYIEQNCTITGWHVRSDISGSVVFDVKRSGVSLAGSEKPTLSASTSNSDLALSTWTTSLLAGDIIEFVIDSASTLTRATLTILVTKT